MLDHIFAAVLSMALSASFVICAVLLARLALKKAPKVFSYALWAVVLFRLLCPVSVTAGISLMALLDTPVTEVTAHTSAAAYVPRDVVQRLIDARRQALQASAAPGSHGGGQPVGLRVVGSDL